MPKNLITKGKMIWEWKKLKGEQKGALILENLFRFLNPISVCFVSCHHLLLSLIIYFVLTVESPFQTLGSTLSFYYICSWSIFERNFWILLDGWISWFVLIIVK